VDRNDLVLAALASVPDVEYQAVHLQKLFFLIDENCADAIDGKKFNFGPNDFGPYDKAVFSAVEELARQNLVQIGRHRSRYRIFALTPEGLIKGKVLLRKLPSDVRQYIRDVVKWLLRSDFDKIVQTIYKEYPEMKRNGVYRASAE
jgi:uncharacterized protein